MSSLKYFSTAVLVGGVDSLDLRSHSSSSSHSAAAAAGTVKRTFVNGYKHQQANRDSRRKFYDESDLRKHLDDGDDDLLDSMSSSTRVDSGPRDNQLWGSMISSTRADSGESDFERGRSSKTVSRTRKEGRGGVRPAFGSQIESNFLASARESGREHIAEGAKNGLYDNLQVENQKTDTGYYYTRLDHNAWVRKVNERALNMHSEIKNAASAMFNGNHFILGTGVSDIFFYVFFSTGVFTFLNFLSGYEFLDFVDIFQVKLPNFIKMALVLEPSSYFYNSNEIPSNSSERNETIFSDFPPEPTFENGTAGNWNYTTMWYIEEPSDDSIIGKFANGKLETTSSYAMLSGN